MTTITLYGGPLKKVLIQRAFGMCGQSVTEFELTPEEYDLGLQAMNDIAGTLGAISFNLPPNGDGDPEDESGLDAKDVLGFTVRLAQEISSNIGKAFAPNGRQVSAVSALVGRYQPIPMMQLGRNTPRGTGNRYWSGPWPYFVTSISSGEPSQ
jgi:hypothetical protein